MKRIEKVFIGIGVLLILLLSASIYVNYQLDHLVTSLNRPGVLFVDTETGGIDASGDGTETGSNMSVSPSEPGYQPSEIPSTDQARQAPATVSGISGQRNSGSQKIAREVQGKIDKPVAKEDLIKAGLIILRKLDSDEISFLYNVGQQDSYTVEELKRTRAILLNKLSSEDIKTLRKLGAKYGKQLRVLDPTYEIK